MARPIEKSRDWRQMAKASQGDARSECSVRARAKKPLVLIPCGSRQRW